MTAVARGALASRGSARLAPRAWLAWSLAAVTVALISSNPVYRGLVALVALNVVLA